MIPAEQLQLLTAAVDGELSPAEGVRVRQLLADSAEARELFARLQADSTRLRKLSPVAPPADLYARIMDRLPVATPAPAPAARPFRSARSRPWLSMAVAASLLLAVTAGSFLFFSRDNGSAPNQTGSETADNGDRTHAKPGASEPSWFEVLPRENGPPPSIPHVAEPPTTAVAQVPTPVRSSEPPDELPPPRPVAKDGYAFPPLPPLPPLDLIQVRLPFLASVSDLARDDIREKLADELGRDPAIRIDLFTNDPARATELFKSAAKGSGLSIHTDGITAERVKRKQASAYVVYTESLTPTEVRNLLAKLAAADAKQKQRVFDMLHATAAQVVDQKELKDVLGTDPGPWKRTQPGHGTAPTKPEPKSISAGTGDQLTKNLTSPATKPGEKPAVLMTLTPAAYRTHPAMSKELKEFLTRRGERKASAVPVMIVIRHTGG